MSGYLKYDNQNLFLEKFNKIILTEYCQFYEFMKNIKGIEDGKSKVEYNNLKLTNKNTIVIDLSSISSLVMMLSDNNKLTEEYIKLNLEKLIFSQDDEEELNNIVKQYLIKMFGNRQTFNVEIDYLKILKNNSNIKIQDKEDFINMINFILDSDTIKQIFVIYKKSILNELKMGEIEYIENDKMCFFEICDKESHIDFEDNILIFDKEITQLRADDFYDLIIRRGKFYKDDNKELYSFLINKILFYAIDRKEVDIMKKYDKEISEMVEILQDEFKISLKNTSDYI